MKKTVTNCWFGIKPIISYEKYTILKIVPLLIAQDYSEPKRMGKTGNKQFVKIFIKILKSVFSIFIKQKLQIPSTTCLFLQINFLHCW